MLCHW